MAVLGPGELIGEEVFLNRESEVRNTSARALVDSEVEVWHPSLISREYEQIPPALKYIAENALSRLSQLKTAEKQLGSAEKKGKAPTKKKAAADQSKRGHYRKEVNITCEYVPINPPADFQLPLRGLIFDISMSGVGMEVFLHNASVVSHTVGDLFRIKTVLPNGKPLEVTAEITFTIETKPKMRLGMSFVRLSDVGEARKNLGFFLLPT